MYVYTKSRLRCITIRRIAPEALMTKQPEINPQTTGRPKQHQSLTPNSHFFCLLFPFFKNRKHRTWQRFYTNQRKKGGGKKTDKRDDGWYTFGIRYSVRRRSSSINPWTKRGWTIFCFLAVKHCVKESLFNTHTSKEESMADYWSV